MRAHHTENDMVVGYLLSTKLRMRTKNKHKIEIRCVWSGAIVDRVRVVRV